MGLKRRNPARHRLFTAPEMLAALSGPATNEALVGPDVPRKAATGADARPTPPPSVSGEQRHRMIAVAAYGHAERTGFTSDPVANWLVAEREIDALLAREAS